jgi:alpha-L-rhamnosidase
VGHIDNVMSLTVLNRFNRRSPVKSSNLRPASRSLVALVVAVALMFSVMLAVATPASAADPALTVGGLQTNARTNPLGISGEAPTFGWKSASTARGVVQSAYEIRVGTSSQGDDAWSSGKVESDQQVDIAYGGTALASQTRYHWQVKVWDGNGVESAWSAPAWFETGILSAGEWQGDWIGTSATGEVDTWTNYTADIDFDIADLAIGVFVRAANTSNALMWQISTADGSGVPKLRPHRRVNGGYALLDNKAIPGITSAELLEGTHRLSVTVDGNLITTSLDGREIDRRTDDTFKKGFVGFRQDYADGKGDEAADIKAVKVTAKTGAVLLDTDFSAGNPFNGGKLTAQGLRVAERKDVLYRSKDANKPLLRKGFTTAPGKTVEAARVYASAQGVYELQLNGKKVGDQFLAPGWTEYRKRIQYQTYDVTDQIRNGDNALGAELGDGWWAGKIASFGFNHYGSSLGLIAQLRIDYTDGTSQVVKTDTTWKSHFGPYVDADNIEGETYDANAEQPGWDAPGFDDAGWGAVTAAKNTTSLLVAQPDEPVRATGELPATKHTTPKAGTEIYDLSQNMVGVARLRLQGVAGQTVTIRYGEVLNPDGTLYTANLRSAKVTDRYTFKTTGTVVYTPKFTQHGFRFVEITGASVAPGLEDVTGVVWGSDLADTGTLETSDPMLNQLQSNISWGQRGNFLSVPTDTPARDERLGWTGDINVFAPTASYLTDTRGFLAKWMTDLRDAAYSNGDFPGIAPVVPNAGDFGSGLGWSDAGITVPYAVWKAHGDQAIVNTNYVAMEKFLRFVKNSAGSDLIDSNRGHWEDWLNLEDPTSVAELGTMYYAEDARMLSEMAASIGETGDAEEFAALSKDVREAFVDTFVAADGTIKSNSQAVYAMALGMGMVADDELRAKVGVKYVAKLKASDYHLTTGFLGTPWLLPALSVIGRDDLAYTMLLHKSYPSWGYEIENGATTMWERWNSIMPSGEFGDVNMNSFNHYAYGAVGDWMYQNIAGIAPLEAGYKKSRIAPVVTDALTQGRGTFESVYGTISSEWKTTGTDLTLDVEVPVNTTSQVSIPAKYLSSVAEGSTLLEVADGVSDVTLTDGVATFTVGSGSYSFTVDGDRTHLADLQAEIEKTDAHAADLATAGDLTASDRARIGTSLTAAADGVGEALDAQIAGDEGQVAQRLSTALATVRELKAWTATSTISTPVKGDLTTRFEKLELLFGKGVANSLKVTAVIPPVAEPTLPGRAVAGTVELINGGETALTNVRATVSVDGWKSEPVTITKGALAAGEQAQLPFTATVPVGQAPGTYAASVAVTFTTADGTFTVQDATPWVSVDSGVEIPSVTSTHPVGGTDDLATVTTTVKNNGDATVAGQVKALVPDGWEPGSVSERVTVAPGASREITQPVLVSNDVVAGDVPITATFVADGVTLASKDANLVVTLAAPAAGTIPGQVDHVDFGDSASETAHALDKSSSSGSAPGEAGVTRRYAHRDFPGSWFSAEVSVPAGQPFILRNLETFDGPRTKKYNVSVDGVLVRNVEYKRVESGQGLKTYQLLVDDPAALAQTADGKARIRFDFPKGNEAFHDPSIADTWVLPVPKDVVAPVVSATVASDAAPGNNGWFRGDASVSVTASDNRPGAVTIETGQAAGWQSYVAPVVVTGDGKQSLSYRAKDAAGNTSGEQQIAVWIDGTAPTTQLAVTRGSGIENADKATLAFTAQDALSGVASTSYRVDGGEWAVLGDAAPSVEGFGRHTVEFFTTDVAGNPEPLRSLVVDLADVDTIATLVAPQVSGLAVVGSTLSATTGSWNTKGLSFGFQWLRDGKPTGQTGASYRVGAADIGHRVSVQVTASKAGRSGSARSAETNTVAKVAGTTTVKYSKSSVKKGQKVKLSIAVTAPGVRPTGSVQVLENGKRVKTVKLSSSGKASYSLKLTRKGLRSITVKYTGSSTVAADSSPTKKIRVR